MILQLYQEKDKSKLLKVNSNGKTTLHILKLCFETDIEDEKRFNVPNIFFFFGKFGVHYKFLHKLCL
jgi:hypothetical protein